MDFHGSLSSNHSYRAREHEDRIQKSYPGKFDGKNGYLMMSNQKLVFVNEEGFIRKTSCAR
jgi:hypothetical protein